MLAAKLFIFLPIILVFAATIFAVMYKKNQSPQARYRSREPYLTRESVSDSAEISAEASRSENMILEDADLDLSLEQNAASSSSSMTKPDPDALIVLGVLADPEQPYVGYELLQALLSAGLRYGKRGIFHRHEELSGRGAVLFSLASASAPGTFELPKMGGFSTPGLTLFIQPADVKNPLLALQMMLDTAHQLVDDLGGTLWDDERNLLTSEKIDQWRSQVMTYIQV